MERKVVQLKKINTEMIVRGFGKTDYADCYQINTYKNYQIDELVNKVFLSPHWADHLMKLRNKVVAIFGLKTGSSHNKLDYYSPGSKAGFFTVIERSDNEILMGENDSHLNFRVSVKIEKKDNFNVVSLTTIVKFNNSFGRLYFLPVKPFHKLIIKSILKRTA